MRQLVLNLPLHPQHGVEDFYPTEGTRQAVQLLSSAFKLAVIVGPRHSGKTHLLHIWAATHNALVHTGSCPAEMPTSAMVIDDLANLPPADQVNLFHALNHIHNAGLGNTAPVLLASSQPVTELPLLPDLKSRLQRALVAEIRPPSDAELRLIFLKWLADRQIVLQPAVVDYIFARAERTMADLYELVAALDELSLESKRSITIPLVRDILTTRPQQE